MVIPSVVAIAVILSSFFVFVKPLYALNLRAIYVPKVVIAFGEYVNLLK